MAIKTNERDYRNFTDFEIREDNNEMWIEGYAVVFDTPTVLYEYDGIQYKEQISRSALDETDMKDVILNYNHDGKVIARTRNKTLQLEIDQIGLKVRARLDGTEEGRRLYEEVKGGYLDKMSFSFTVSKENYQKEERLRNIEEIKRLYDVSIVSLPAYQNTTVSARSYFETKVETEKKIQEMTELRKKLILKTYL